MKFEVPHITIENLAMESELFTSKSDLRRISKQNGVKLNGVSIDEQDLKSNVELGDFLNLFIDGRGLPLSRSFGTHQLILIERGKIKKILLKVDASTIEILN